MQPSSSSRKLGKPQKNIDIFLGFEFEKNKPDPCLAIWKIASPGLDFWLVDNPSLKNMKLLPMFGVYGSGYD